MKKISLLILLIIVTGCAREKVQKEENTIEENQMELVVNSKDIIIGYQNYASVFAQSYVLKSILENKGYEVGFEEVTRDTMFQSMENQEIDVILGCWLPDLDFDRLKEYEEVVEDVGVNFQFNEINLFVPAYSNIAATNELNFYRSQLGRRIYVLEGNSHLRNQLEDYLNTNNISYTLEDVTATQLDEIIGNAVNENEWFVFAGWSPHYLLGKYELRGLEGDKIFTTYPQQMHTLLGRNYENEGIRKIIKKMYLEPWEMNELIYALNEVGEDQYDKVVKEWMERNPTFSKRFN